MRPVAGQTVAGDTDAAESTDTDRRAAGNTDAHGRTRTAARREWEHGQLHSLSVLLSPRRPGPTCQTGQTGQTGQTVRRAASSAFLLQVRASDRRRCWRFRRPRPRSSLLRSTAQPGQFEHVLEDAPEISIAFSGVAESPNEMSISVPGPPGEPPENPSAVRRCTVMGGGRAVYRDGRCVAFVPFGCFPAKSDECASVDHSYCSIKEDSSVTT